MIWQIRSTGSDETERLGEVIGGMLKGGEVIELHADLGGGKTTFTRGLARGLGVKQNVTSPTFTLSRLYQGKGNIELRHFDFYRLAEAGVMTQQLEESINEPNVVTVVEWGKVIKGVLPASRLTISFNPISDDPEGRQIKVKYPEALSELIQKVESAWDNSKP